MGKESSGQFGEWQQDAWLTKSQLRERGWTDGAIRRFLGEADRQKPNPYRSTGPKMQLFARGRVVAAESTSGFIAWQAATREQREKLSIAASRRAEEARAALREHIANLRIKVPDLGDKRTVFRMAVKHYNTLWERRGEYDRVASLEDDEAFLRRIAMNMLRHSYTSYERQLDRLFGQIGREEGYALLRERVTQSIVARYPYLR
ncbi:hypothetical protein J2T57_001618 [Natronocella acetinitrilica]|uniref:Uncharacterized protein n=1 Tax=Natronocella acetinitrilica TaxID=414046 RepID=A0AAE3G4C2_9GAMM|nr:hypothetical protein [Natronocella acetinitrilica]MCP1674516.1 hypothetical protein [Natronocella acetinitrilica]